MSTPGWYHKEAIEHQLERLGAETWHYQDARADFKDERLADDDQVELSSTVYGAVLGRASEMLRTLEELQDGVGDASISEALFRATPGR